MCPASRTLLAAAFAGMVVSSIFANDTAGWIVAVIVGVLVHLAQRRRPELASCALPRDRAQPSGAAQAELDAGRKTGPAQPSVHDGTGSTPISPQR